MSSDSEVDYVLDANVFIEAFKRYYAFDLVPTFWDTLEDLASTQKIVSVDRVFDELMKETDDLSNWIEEHIDYAFKPTDSNEVIINYGELQNWVNNQSQFTPAARDEFADPKNADGWLVAYAIEHDLTIVTHEVFDAEIKKKVKIPNLCEAFDINYLDTFQMLRESKVTL